MHYKVLVGLNRDIFKMGRNIGKFFHSLKENSYLKFLSIILPVLLENANMQVRHDLWFKDGVPAYCHRIVRYHLDFVLTDRCIGRGSKEQIYQTPVDSVKHLEY